MAVETDVVRRLFDAVADLGVCIEVGPGSDGFGVEIRTPDTDSQKYYGELNLVLTKEMAEALGHALVACAAEAKP